MQIKLVKEDNEITVHQETIELKVNGKTAEFRLIHNFNMLNLDIRKAITEWG